MEIDEQINLGLVIACLYDRNEITQDFCFCLCSEARSCVNHWYDLCRITSWKCESNITQFHKCSYNVQIHINYRDFLPISHPEIVEYSFVKDTTIVNEGLSHPIIDAHENAMIGSCQNPLWENNGNHFRHSFDKGGLSLAFIDAWAAHLPNMDDRINYCPLA